jgi:prevent-host-death family protein
VIGSVNIHEAKTSFSKLLKRVALGEEVVIARAGKPVARLVPFGERLAVRQPGSAKGLIKIREDFDARLPKKIQKAFE